MVRLIVEEGGHRRAFRLGHGVLTVGSGAEARLKLTTGDVAALHAEIEVRGEEVFLRPRSGVLPPTVGGIAATGEVLVPLGMLVEIGAARIWVEDEAAPPAAASPAPAPAAAVGTGSPAASDDEREHRRRAAIERVKRAPKRGVVERTKPRHKKGLPTGAIIAMVLGGVALVVLIGIRAFGTASETVLDPDNVLLAARGFMDNGQAGIAEDKIKSIEGRNLSEAQRAEIKSIRQAIEDAKKVQALHKKNALGTTYRGNQLEKYEKIFLQGNPEKHKIRLFLKRCQEFRRRWPDHHEMDWVDRHESRFEGIVRLSDPPTIDDVLWEVRDFVNTMPRHYKEAFAMLDEFAATANSADLLAVDERRQELIAARNLYAMDRLQQAKYELQNKDSPGKAVWWLVNSVCYLGDPEMENDAARRLLQMPDIKAHLVGYKESRPEYFAELMKNRIVREEAQRLGIY